MKIVDLFNTTTYTPGQKREDSLLDFHPQITTDRDVTRLFPSTLFTDVRVSLTYVKVLQRNERQRGGRIVYDPG